MDRYLVFFDGSILICDQKEIDEAKKFGRETIMVKGSAYKLSAISKNLTAQDYYDQYPDKRPETIEEYKIEDDRYKGLTIEQIAELNQYRFKGLLKGLKQFIDEEMAKGITPKNAIKIYNDKLDRYKKKFANAPLQTV